MITLETDLESNKKEENKEQYVKTKFCFTDLNFVKLLDLLNLQKEKEDVGKLSDINISSQMHILTDMIENIIQQQEASDSNPPAVISQPLIEQLDIPEKEIIS